MKNGHGSGTEKNNKVSIKKISLQAATKSDFGYILLPLGLWDLALPCHLHVADPRCSYCCGVLIEVDCSMRMNLRQSFHF